MYSTVLYNISCDSLYPLVYSYCSSIIHTMSINSDGVLFSGADNGTMRFWDWKTGYNFQQQDTIVQPGKALFQIFFLIHYASCLSIPFLFSFNYRIGSLHSEAGIYASCFDHSGW